MAVNYPSEHMSDGERLLWFQIFAMKLPRPIYQHKFDSERKWRVDFAYVAERIAVEVEGMGRTDASGRRKPGPSNHRTVKGYDENIRKYNELRLSGWTLLQFTTVMVKDGYAIQTVTRALKQAGAIQ